MASKRIRVMISSRCSDSIRKAGGGSVKLSDLRIEAKRTIEAFRLFNRDTFECWVHEDEAALPGNADVWDQCLNAVGRCDVLLVLFNGNAGFGKSREGIGICHAELMAAMQTAAAKVRLIDVKREASIGKLTGDKERNSRFTRYLEGQEVGRRFAKDDQEALRFMLDALQDAVVEMVRLGGSETRRGRFDTGAPLDWSRLDYGQRKAAMEKVLNSSLKSEGAVPSGANCIHIVEGKQVLFCCHAVPAAMSVAAAREMIGRPFLHDHELIDQLEDSTTGPVHVIACHKGVTENQAVSLLGFPDATIVTPSFGVYVADNVEKIQLVLLANCRDESSTRYAVQRFFDWLLRSGEAGYLADRARGRRAIVSVIAEQSRRGRNVPARSTGG